MKGIICCMPASTSIERTLEELAHMLALHSCDLRLVSERHVLPHSETVEDCGIVEGSVVHIGMRFHGGGKTTSKAYCGSCGGTGRKVGARSQQLPLVSADSANPDSARPMDSPDILP